MAIEKLGTFRDARLAVSTTTTTPAPTPADDHFDSRHYRTVTTFISFDGTVNDATVQLYLFDGGEVYLGASTTVGSADGNVAIDWDIGQDRRFTFGVTSISGGGEITVRVGGSA